MICNTCGSSIDENVNFCPICGAKKEVESSNETSNENLIKICESCGNSIQDNEMFCGNCGKKVLQEVTNENNIQAVSQEMTNNNSTHNAPQEMSNNNFSQMAPQEMLINNSTQMVSQEMIRNNLGSSNGQPEVEPLRFQFRYSRGVDFGRKVTTSDIEISNQLIKITQKLAKPFRKTKSTYTEVHANDINQVRVKNAIFPYDLIWAILSFVFGFVFAPLFLLSILFIWIGFHRELVVSTSRGIIKIPAKGSKNKFFEFINVILNLNPRIIKK